MKGGFFVPQNTANEERFMRRALQLSLKGRGLTYPNPMVGAVIVRDGRIIGEGWHRGAGQSHAEVEALAHCIEDPRGAAIYVTLEPCNHYGRTPPCTEAILRAGITEVYYAIDDPNPVAGGGAQRLREAGVAVRSGICREEALEVNRAFIYHCQTGRPWVVMKAAMSLDGKIACRGGESRWITGEAARRSVHELRSQVGAVLVGVGTAIQDRPRLTDRRRGERRQPLKVVLDSELRIPLDSPLVTEEPQRLVVFCSGRASDVTAEHLAAQGATVINLGPSLELESVLMELGARGVRSVLVEGGSKVFTAFHRCGLVHEYALFYAPIFIGGADSLGVLGGGSVARPMDAPRMTVRSIHRMGPDILIRGYSEGGVACLQG